MNAFLLTLAVLPLLAWLYLLLFHGGFWRGRERLDGTPGTLAAWPAVVALVPARNEADVIGRAVASLLGQDYPGDLKVILIDDHSDDGTAAVAEAAAESSGQAERLLIRSSRDLPAGWLGKPWALSEGLRHADELAAEAPYVWLTDADIAHDPQNLRRLVATAETGDLDLTSQMVLLQAQGFWARLLIPAFVFFFQKLYPFAWVGDHGRKLAGAAGGCVLLRRAALKAAGGFAVIQDALIDDCTLAQAIKEKGRPGNRPGGGRLFLALTTSAFSLRPYDGLGGVWRMVARSAYTQLKHSPLLLFGTLLGMVLVYLLGPGILLTLPWHGALGAAALGLLAWAMMAGAFLPTLRLYRQPAGFAWLLPLAGLLYAAMTFESALAHWQGRGGAWKGRVAGGAALERADTGG